MDNITQDRTQQNLLAMLVILTIAACLRSQQPGDPDAGSRNAGANQGQAHYRAWP